MGATGSNYTGCPWTHVPGYCHIVWWMRGNWNHLNLRKKNQALVEERKRKTCLNLSHVFFPLTEMSVQWWEAPPHLHCFLPLLVFMGTYSSFQSFLWITDAASRSCSLLCSLTITSLERLRFCVCKCNSCRGGCGSLQESVSRMWGLLATLPTLPLGYFTYRVNPVLPVPGANQLSNIMSTLARFSFVIFFFSSSSERPSFFKTRLTT